MGLSQVLADRTGNADNIGYDIKILSVVISNKLIFPVFVILHFLIGCENKQTKFQRGQIFNKCPNSVVCSSLPA